MAEPLPPLIATLLGDAGQLFDVLDDVEARLEAFAHQDFTAQLSLNVDKALADLAAFEHVAEATAITIPVALDLGPALAELAGLKAALSGADAGLAAKAAVATAAGSGGGGSRGGGGGSFLGTLLGSGSGGISKGLFGFGTPLLPKIPLAGFGTLGALAGLGPESLLSLGAGVAGSAAHGALGGAALGITSAAVTGVGMATDSAGLGQALGDTKQYGQLQANLKQTAAVYGTSSTEYKAAMYAYTQWSSTLSKGYIQALAVADGTKTAFQTMFDKVTSSAATTGAKIINSAMQVGMKFLPTIGKFAGENMKIIQSSLQPLFAWLTGPGLVAFNQIEQVFQDHLPKAMHAFDQGVELAIKTIAHFAPQTGGLIDFLDKLFTKLNGPGFDKWIGEVQRAIDSFRVWEKFIKSVGTAIYELFHNDAGTGEAFIVTLTNLINKFNDWAKTVAGGDKLHEYMEAHKQEVLQLVGLFGNLVSTMGQVHLTVGPALMEIVGDLLKFVNLLLEIPGVGKILSYVIAFELLSKHISILKPLVTAFNGEIKKLALEGIVALGGAIASLGGPFEKLGGWLQGVGTQSQTAAEKASANMQQAADSMAGVSDVMQTAADAMTVAAGAMTTAAEKIETAFAGIGTAATGAAADVDRASESMVVATDVTAAEVEANAGKIDLALGSEGLAGDLGGAGLAAGGLARGGTTAAETEGEGMSEGFAASLLKGGASKAIGGLIAVQLYDAFAEKPLSKVVGKNAASALGDVGTGAALGTAIEPGLGTIVGSLAGLFYAERGPLADILKSLFGSAKPGTNKPQTPKFPHSTPGLGNPFPYAPTATTPRTGPRGSGLPTAGGNPAFPHASPGLGTPYKVPKPTQTQSQLAKDSTLQKQLNALDVLRFNVAAAKAQDGVFSAQYVKALAALKSTEEKYLPHAAKHEDMSSIDLKIAGLKTTISDLKASQHADQVNGNQQLSKAQATLAAAKSQMVTLKDADASKQAIQQAKQAVDTATTHVDQVKSIINAGNNVNQTIKSDTGKLSHLQTIETIMGKVNTDTSKLHTDLAPMAGSGINIAKLPTQAMKVQGKIQVSVS